MRISLLLVAGFVAVLQMVAAIYPEDHWKFSKELTTDNFESEVQAAIDAGKTMMAPAWNSIVKAFASNNDVVFGDINLSKNPVRGNHNPGAGGWPTIKYFNKQTGIEGAPYDKKTNDAMCDELGNEDNMQAYVELAAGTSLCNVQDPVKCNDKEKTFIEKWSKIAPDAVKQQAEAEIVRLTGMKGNRLTADAASWIGKRIAILKQFVVVQEVADEL